MSRGKESCSEDGRDGEGRKAGMFIITKRKYSRNATTKPITLYVGLVK